VSPFPHLIAHIISITYLLAPPFLTHLHFSNRVLCWFEDLDKGNVLHIKPYYLYELIIVFHAGLRILIDIYSNRNHAYRWQLVTIPRMCTLQLSTTTFPRPCPSSILDEMTFTCFLQTVCSPDSPSSINLNEPDM
jgi:hypothetical protein